MEYSARLQTRKNNSIFAKIFVIKISRSNKVGTLIHNPFFMHYGHFDNWIFTARWSFHQQLFGFHNFKGDKESAVICCLTRVRLNSQCVGCLYCLVFWEHLPHLCIPPTHHHHLLPQPCLDTHSRSIIPSLAETHGSPTCRSYHHNKPHSLEHFLHSAPSCASSLPDQTPPPPTSNPSLTAPTFSHTLHPTPTPPPNLLLISTCLKALEPREPKASRASHRALSPVLTLCHFRRIRKPTADHTGKRASGTWT